METNADGTLDEDFGDDGVEMVDVSQTQYESIYAMAVQPDGKVILAGSLYDELADSYDAVLVRVMEDPQNPGQMILDDDFGTDGVAVLDAGAYDEVYDLKLDGQGRIIAGGPVGSQWWAARYTTGGDLDPTFGTVSGQTRTGWRTVDFTGSGTETFAGLELYPDGRVLLGGYKASNVILARLTAAGDDDTSFSDDGQATLGGSYAEAALDLALQPDGRIVVAGMWFGSSPYNYQVLAGRVNADGTMDSSFGDGGWTRLDLTGVNSNSEYAVSVAIRADGKIVLAGQADSELFIARLSGLTRHYAMQDANWTITGIVDPTTGQAVERYVFTPYGGRTILDAAFEQRSTSSFGWIVGHQGLAVDAETGLVYNRARYLDTSMGRFLQRDPLGTTPQPEKHDASFVGTLGTAAARTDDGALDAVQRARVWAKRRFGDGHADDTWLWAYKDGLSLYQYTRSSPTYSVDPAGMDRYLISDYGKLWAHYGIAVDTWKLAGGTWIKTGVLQFDFNPSILGLLGVLTPVGCGGVVTSQPRITPGATVKTIPSTPQEDNTLLGSLQASIVERPYYNLYFCNCRDFAVQYLSVGMKKMPKTVTTPPPPIPGPPGIY